MVEKEEGDIWEWIREKKVRKETDYGNSPFYLHLRTISPWCWFR
jgi:hypothetical protein